MYQYILFLAVFVDVALIFVCTINTSIDELFINYNIISIFFYFLCYFRMFCSIIYLCAHFNSWIC